MLLSPGNSPHHISSKKTLVTAAETTQSSSSNSLPSNSNPRRKRSPEVLDEDTYIAALEQIVKRDFFPDLPKLRDRLDWLEAVRSGDPVQIRDAQLKILECRRGGGSGGKTPIFAFSTSTDGKIRATPASSFFNSPTPVDFEGNSLRPNPEFIDFEGKRKIDAIKDGECDRGAHHLSDSFTPSKVAPSPETEVNACSDNNDIKAPISKEATVEPVDQDPSTKVQDPNAKLLDHKRL